MTTAKRTTASDAVALSAHDWDDFTPDDQGDTGTGDHAELAAQLDAERG
jgi:hypothetical protein